MPIQVFDGHGGVSAAAFAERHLLDALLSQTSFPAKPADSLVSSLASCMRLIFQLPIPSFICSRAASWRALSVPVLPMHAHTLGLQ